jgi:hypothetical protein
LALDNDDAALTDFDMATALVECVYLAHVSREECSNRSICYYQAPPTWHYPWCYSTPGMSASILLVYYTFVLFITTQAVISCWRLRYTTIPIDDVSIKVLVEAEFRASLALRYPKKRDHLYDSGGLVVGLVNLMIGCYKNCICVCVCIQVKVDAEQGNGSLACKIYRYHTMHSPRLRPANERTRIRIRIRIRVLIISLQVALEIALCTVNLGG